MADMPPPQPKKRVTLAPERGAPEPAAKADPIEELRKLYPDADVIAIGGKEIPLVPLQIRQIGKVARALGRIHVDTSKDASDLLVEMVVWHTEDLIEAVVGATSAPEEFIAALPFDDFAKITLAVFKINQDFFDRQLPKLAGEVEAILASVGAGRKSLPISSETASAIPAH